MLYDRFLGLLLPSVTGRREGGLFTLATGLSPRAGARMAEQPSGVGAIRRIARERLRMTLVERGHSWKEAAGILEMVPGIANPDAAPTPLAALVALSPGGPGSGYTRTLAVSIQLDHLADALRSARECGSVEAAREAVAAAGFAFPEWFREANEAPDVGESASQWQPWLAANSWPALDKPLRILCARSIFHWLACWDVDFCLYYFRAFEPRPTFPWVTPAIDARAFQGAAPGKRRRALIDSPTKRLLEVTAALLHKLRFRQWPTATPKLKELASWTEMSERDLTKWGTLERPFPYAKFEEVWMAVAEKDPGRDARGGPVSPPFPLYLAAKVFELMLLHRNEPAPGRRESTIISLGEELYGRYWHQALEAAKAVGAKVGDEAWPPILDIPLAEFPELGT